MKGLSGALYHNRDIPPETGKSPDVLRVVLGVLLIAFAQLFTASQFVLEEFIMAKHTIHAIRMVGWEGVFGFSITIIGMPILWALFGMGDSGKGDTLIFHMEHVNYFLNLKSGVLLLLLCFLLGISSIDEILI